MNRNKNNLVIGLFSAAVIMLGGCGGTITGRTVKIDPGSVGEKKTALAFATIKAYFEDPETGEKRTVSGGTDLLGGFTVRGLPADTPVYIEITRTIDNWHYWSWRKSNLIIPAETGELDLGEFEVGIQYPPTPVPPNR